MTDLLERLTQTLADRYRIEREVGSGGMATVYLAEDLKHHRPVAIKVLLPTLAAAIGPERFLREIEVTARLNHPHILPLLDSGEADGLLFYVMPFVEGESLRERLDREKQLSVEDAVQIAAEVADALGFAHDHDVLHRDIKPENILFEGGHAVVADFGLALAITAAGGRRLTETGIAVGTPEYMSPEQASGERALNERSDLYSLGCVLYEMLAGEPPFTGPTIESVARQHLTAEPRSVTTLRATVPEEISQSLVKVLAKAPADRFGSAAEFRNVIAPRGTISPAGIVAVDRPPKRRWVMAGGAVGVTAAVVVVLATVLIAIRAGRANEQARTAIAVLPFQNLSADGPHVYFAGGLHDELLTQLAKVGALSVRGRTSVMGYGGTTRPIREIADELGVGTIVVATVQVVGERLRVNVQLIEAVTDEHLWAESYDRTLEDAFAIQRDIAQQVVAAVGGVLTPEEASAIDATPTENAEAYQLYLQGREYYFRWRVTALQQHLRIAQELCEQAVALDSTFALAYAALSQVHGHMSWARLDPSPERLAQQQDAAERALRLAPNLPQAHVAMGLVHYFGRRDWSAALEEYLIALRGLPNDVELRMWIGYAHRRLGNWEQVLQVFDTVAVLDPRRSDAFADLGGNTLLVLRRYPEAAEYYSRSLALAPDAAGTDVQRGRAWLNWQGRLDSLRAALRRHPTAIESDGALARWYAYLLFLERQADSLLLVLEDSPWTIFEWQLHYEPTALYAGWVHQMRGDDIAARAAFDSALVLLDSAVAILPSDWRVHAARGLALAGLGRRQDALTEASWLRESALYREDRVQGTWAVVARAQILAQVGETDGALAEIERVLARPSDESIHTIRLDPRYDPIRDDPRFLALLEQYAHQN
jgi:TolB-like protein/Flp pilus assembly protein TadD